MLLRLIFSQKWVVLVSLLCLMAQPLLSQPLEAAYSYSRPPGNFSLEECLTLVQLYHPVARQAALLSPQAKARLRRARGGFDPKLYGWYDNKLYERKTYWQNFEGGVKIPLGLGIELKGGFARNEGEYLDPKQNLPSQGQGFLGGAITLGQGLFIDQRRAALRQAQIFQNMAEVEQLRLINDLFFHAAKTYWEWAATYESWQLFQRSVSLSRVRFEAVKGAYRAGKYARIDTTEAMTQLQQLIWREQDAYLKYQKASLELGVFLWADEDQPLEITEELIPTGLPGPETNAVNQDSLQLLLNLVSLHPELRQYEYKLAELDVQRRLKAEKLKPVVDLDWAMLSPSDAFLETPSPGPIGDWADNYKLGVTVGFPIFLRKERGDLELARIKIQDTELKQTYKTQSLNNKVLAYHQEHNGILNQVRTYEAAVGNYLRLLRAEQDRFDAGESSLFLINSREQKWVDAEAKRIQLRGKLGKARAGLAWASGLLGTVQ